MSRFVSLLFLDIPKSIVNLLGQCIGSKLEYSVKKKHEINRKKRTKQNKKNKKKTYTATWVAGLISHFTSQSTNSLAPNNPVPPFCLPFINTKQQKEYTRAVEVSPHPNTKRVGCNEAFMLFSRKFNPILPAGDALKFKNVKKKTQHKNHSICSERFCPSSLLLWRMALIRVECVNILRFIKYIKIRNSENGRISTEFLMKKKNLKIFKTKIWIVSCLLSTLYVAVYLVPRTCVYVALLPLLNWLIYTRAKHIAYKWDIWVQCEALI